MIAFESRDGRAQTANVWIPGLIATALVVAGATTAGCKRQYRRQGESASTAPDERVEENPDPRFPRHPDAGTDRFRLWVEQPRETGGVSSTRLANAIAERLGSVEAKCCTEPDSCAGLEGRMLIEFEIAPDGTVRAARLGETSLYDRRFQECLLERAGSWRLVEHEGSEPAIVTVPIRIQFEPDEISGDADTD